MARLTIIYGLLLIVLGVGSYFVTGQASKTALIPALFGVPILLCGVVALRDHLRRHAMHGAAALALLGFLGSAPGLLKAFTLLGGGEVARPAAVTAQATMALLSLVFLVLCIRSFINARRAPAV
ncbi:MAG TPA: hypothetical protein VMW27_04465 [Thermoanaerobaculia bacterium]|nr:hypothetical protein [Thermoanaerobaculia bacterium]